MKHFFQVKEEEILYKLRIHRSMIIINETLEILLLIVVNNWNTRTIFLRKFQFGKSAMQIR